MTLSKPDACRLSLLMGLFLVSSLLLREFARQRLRDNGVSLPTATNLGAMTGIASLAVLAWPLIRRYGIRPRRYFRRPPSIVRTLAAGTACGLIFRLLDWVLLVSGGAAPTGGFSVSLNCHAVPAMSLPVTVVAVPLVEEVVHRGILLEALGAFGPVISVGLTALVFAALHGTFAMPFAFGIVAACLALRSGTLWTPLIAHAVFNLAAIAEHACLRVTMTAPGVALIEPLPSMVLSSVLVVLLSALVRAAGTGTGQGPGAARVSS